MNALLAVVLGSCTKGQTQISKHAVGRGGGTKTETFWSKITNIPRTFRNATKVHLKVHFVQFGDINEIEHRHKENTIFILTYFEIIHLVVRIELN